MTCNTAWPPFPSCTTTPRWWSRWTAGSSRTLALGRLVEDLLAHHPLAAHLKRLVECDSPDANYEYVRKGLGVSWLPWSVVHADVKSGLLAPAGGKGLEVKFDVRMFRPKRRLSALAESLWSTIARR